MPKILCILCRRWVWRRLEQLFFYLRGRWSLIWQRKELAVHTGSHPDHHHCHELTGCLAGGHLCGSPPLLHLLLFWSEFEKLHHTGELQLWALWWPQAQGQDQPPEVLLGGMTDCVWITSGVSFQWEGLVKITFFFLWKLNAIIWIKPIQNTEGMDRPVWGEREMQPWRGSLPTEDCGGQVNAGTGPVFSAGTQTGAHLLGVTVLFPLWVCYDYDCYCYILFLFGLWATQRGRRGWLVRCRKWRDDHFSPHLFLVNTWKAKGLFIPSILRNGT